MMEESLMSGFQSSRDVSKSTAKRKHKLENFPLLTRDPELQADETNIYFNWNMKKKNLMSFQTYKSKN